jgi:hypothetical protein
MFLTGCLQTMYNAAVAPEATATAVGAASAESLTGVPLAEVGSAAATVGNLDQTLADNPENRADLEELQNFMSDEVTKEMLEDPGREGHLQRTPHDRRTEPTPERWVYYSLIDNRGHRLVIPVLRSHGCLIASENPLRAEAWRPPEPWRFTIPKGHLIHRPPVLQPWTGPKLPEATKKLPSSPIISRETKNQIRYSRD